MKQVFSGKKKLLKMSEVKPINVPVYDEISVKRLYKEIIADPMMN
jgi:hypothetical protein